MLLIVVNEVGAPMSLADDNPKCPICSDQLQEQPRVLQNKDATRFNCSRCGTFDADRLSLADSEFSSRRHLVSAWIRRQNKIGIKYPFVPPTSPDPAINWYRTLENMGFPQTINEKLDVLLKSYADLILSHFNNQYDSVIKANKFPSVIADVAAKNIAEIYGLNRILGELDYIQANQDYQHIIIKARGWLHFDELHRVRDSGNSAFIAMWFDSSTTKYRDSAIAAIKYCGFKPSIVDQKEFNGFIMEQVVSLIRDSRFVVADFTCRPEIANSGVKVEGGVRGGVYWEAGMAYGMGKPVVQTCEKNDEARRRIHFDLAQYNTIFWESRELSTDVRDLSQPIPNPNFAEKLALRILATVGRGSE